MVTGLVETDMCLDNIILMVNVHKESCGVRILVEWCKHSLTIIHDTIRWCNIADLEEVLKTAAIPKYPTYITTCSYLHVHKHTGITRQ